MDKVLAFWRDEEGATAIEYGLIAGLIAVVLVAVIGGIGDQLVVVFNNILVGLGGTAV
ncbi:MAG: Flp family type IVb pilin [Comamonadaceae bacterium]|nr:MAG: Flp family type IVb pilin [Comamonadaceae bacterium]